MENKLKKEECGIGVKLWSKRTKLINCNCADNADEKL